MEAIIISKKVKFRSSRCNNESGLSIIEYLIALTLIGIAFIAWLQLTATGVKNGSLAINLGDVQALSSDKATELIKQADNLVKNIPKGKSKIGSVIPGKLVASYFDLLDREGKVILPPDKNKTIVFIRQWAICKDYPAKDDITVYVAVIYKETNQILRLAKKVKTDGLKVTKG